MNAKKCKKLRKLSRLIYSKKIEGVHESELEMYRILKKLNKSKRMGL